MVLHLIHHLVQLFVRNRLVSFLYELTQLTRIYQSRVVLVDLSEHLSHLLQLLLRREFDK